MSPLHKPNTLRCSSLLSHAAGMTLRRPRKRVVVPEPTLTPEQQRRSAEIEQELQLARDLQQGLLLEAAPRLRGWELTAVSLPARDLGGDLYDFLDLGAGIQGIMIGDVSGKGLSAALRMAVARTVFRHEARRADQPGPTLAEVNRGVLREIPQGMVTMLYLLLDTAHGVLRMANAGHIFPLFINGSVSEVELSGLPLGVDGDVDYEEASAILNPGDTVLLYTDGVLEAENSVGEIYTYERLAALIEANTQLKPRAIVSLLLRELRAWSGGIQGDDITMVVLRRRLTDLAAELRSVTVDVLGSERANAFWEEQVILSSAAPAATWIAALPDLLKAAQARFGRGLARELNQQLRLALEDYR
ncbi:MAG: serine/threonine-protein phosphatase [Candidatus Viridilinea halotolerans]|uniref:Serine/threonine-protein phosphatase n=1 Tax=Candidatus Viridilinea halotolerans TaxID=2491704 RepID=A0A426TQK3_9CHLR|nr:MAG: serine/threonine-protein phosphatase [Candidatus Viridilinea halotolerans]